MTTTKQYDFLNRLVAISNLPSADTGLTYSYSYSDANQRTRCIMPDGSYWLYEYDALGQLTSGKHYWPDDTPVAGQQFEYGFDDIGNRTTTKAGGDPNGGGLHSASYTANSLNQYSQRDVPGAGDILGIAHAQASVSVNGQTNLSRHGEYFWKDLSINNASAAVWQAVTNQAVLTNATNTVIGSLFLPKTPETFAHDADGNLTNDGRWMLTWDAENRLTKLESYSSAPTASKRRISYTYDSQSRLVRRALEDGSSGSYVLTNAEKLLWKDWLCLADLNATTNTIERSYLWGLDLSGSLQGAGGIGGLLAIGDRTSGITGFPAYDGNGNVTALASGTDGSLSARYEYDPFGRTVSATGPMAVANPMRFSTKRAEDASDLAYYGYRFYNPTTGRWLSRDPIELKGGINAYKFARNSGVNHIDPKGLKCCECVNYIQFDNLGPYLADPDIGEHIYGHRFNIAVTLERKGCCTLYPATLKWWENQDVADPLDPGYQPGTWRDQASGIGPFGPRANSPTILPWGNRRRRCPDTEIVILDDIPGQYIGQNRTLHILVQILANNECDCPFLLTSSSVLQTLTSEPGSPPRITQQSLESPDPNPPPSP